MKHAIASLAAALIVALSAACSDSDPQIGSDTSTDVEHEPTVPGCDAVPDWGLEITGTSSDVGTVSVQVDLLSAGATPTCAGPPCLIVTALSGGGSAESITQVSATRATFTYTNTEIGAGGEAQLLLRWRVLCTVDGGEEERTVTESPWVCADSSTNLSIGLDPCS
jgi:hypothetical protein